MPRDVPKRAKVRVCTSTCTRVFTAALFTRAKEVETTQMSVKRRSVHAKECYSAIKRDEVLIQATTWGNSGNIMPVTEGCLL